MNYILGAAIAILVFAPGSFVAGYVYRDQTITRSLQVTIAWPEAKIDDVKEATGSARRVRQ